MIINFFACRACGRIDEEQIWLKNIFCSRCSGRHFHPIYLGPVRLWLYLLLHPSYLIRALKGE